MLSNGNSPVRISQRPSKIIPGFLPAKLLVSAMRSSFLIHLTKINNSILLETSGPIQPEVIGVADFLTRRIDHETRILSPAGSFARLRVHTHDFAFFNEKGYAHD